MNVGVLPFIVLMGLFVLVLGAIVAVALLFQRWRRKSQEAGYPSLTAYLRAAPRTDREKSDAADLALTGLVLCMLGLLFPPMLLLGLIPFYYGARKVINAWMGLGLADDGDQQGR